MYREGLPDRPCPECGIALVPHELTPRARALACETCGGVWLEPGVEEELKDPAILKLDRALPRGGPSSSSEPASCPVCGKATEERTVDRIAARGCAAHGFWLRGGDLARVFYEPMRTGPGDTWGVAIIEVVLRLAGELFFS